MNVFRCRLLIISLAALSGSIAPATFAAETADSAPTLWPDGTKAAVSLSYDDSVPVHHHTVAPLLKKHGLRGTFYLSVLTIENPEAWKAVAAQGHELGNHSLFHPCRRVKSFESWLPAYYDLADYTPGRFRDELNVADLVLDLLDGGKPRTYGNNCTNLTIGRGDQEQPMDPIIAELFVAARGTLTERPVDPRQPAFTRLGHFNGDGKTFAQMRAEIEDARSRSEWVIYMFHGVGEGTHGLFVDDHEHRLLIEWLDQERDSIWTAPVVDVAQHLRSETGPQN